MRTIIILTALLVTGASFVGSVSAEVPKQNLLDAVRTQEDMDRLTDAQRTELGALLAVSAIKNADVPVPINSIAVTLDKTSYVAGEAVNLGLFLDSPALRSYAETNPNLQQVPQYVAKVSVLGRDGMICIVPSDVSFSATEAVPTASLRSATECDVTAVSVSLHDERERPLGEWTIPIEAVLHPIVDVAPKQDSSLASVLSGSRITIVIVGTLFLIAMFAILSRIITRRGRKGTGMLSILFPMLLAFIVFGTDHAEALTWRSGCSDVSGGSYSDFTATLDKTIYRPGESISVSGSASAYNGTSGESSILHNDLYGTLTNPNGSFTTSLSNGFIFTGSFNTSMSGSRTYTASSITGSYSMYLMSWFGMTHVCNGLLFRDIPFAVVAAPAPTLMLTASPSSVTSGSSSTLAWTSLNATSCTASGGWSGSQSASGTWSTGSLIAAKTYTLTCTGSGGSITRSITVDVTPVVVPAPTLSFNASPISVQSGSSSTLFWNSNNATSCTASDGWSGSQSASGTWSTGGLTAAKTYTLTCTGSGGSITRSITVDVTPADCVPNMGEKCLTDVLGIKGCQGNQNVIGCFTQEETAQIPTWGEHPISFPCGICCKPKGTGKPTFTWGGNPSMEQILQKCNTGYIQCDGSCSGTPTNPTPISASCGPANGTTVAAPPTENLCTQGIPTAVLGSGPWAWTCNGVNGGSNASCSASKLVVSTLRLCQNGIYYAKGGETGTPVALNQGDERNLTAIYGPGTDCTAVTGDIDVTSSITDTASDVVTLLGSNPKILHGNNVPNSSNPGQQSASENVTATYSGQTVIMPVTVLENCVSGCSAEAGNYCKGKTFNADDSCGISRQCANAGTRSCEFNWKEVVPGF
ncbi:MAG: hypothetical protein HGB37_05310 [Candidatus Moranbacteria bacterium]|nr:hypothetical protein [Candidatus Moranbacteria bacterium]